MDVNNQLSCSGLPFRLEESLRAGPLRYRLSGSKRLRTLWPGSAWSAGQVFSSPTDTDTLRDTGGAPACGGGGGPAPVLTPGSLPLRFAVNFEALIVTLSAGGGAVLLALAACCCACCCRRKRSRKPEKGEEKAAREREERRVRQEER